MTLRNYIIAVLLLLVAFSCKEENDLIQEEPEPVVCRTDPNNIYTTCVDPIDTTTFDIATWNIRFFPEQGQITVDAVKRIIDSFNADVIAIQEISDVSQFNNVANALDNWDVKLIDYGYLSLGFIYNTCEIIEVSEVKLVDLGGFYVFPRLPLEIKVKHKNGLETILINLHLKCCNEGYDSRVQASQALKDYVDNTYPEENVIILGDLNDEIISTRSPFYNFISDSQNYLFADMSIAQGPVSEYSYPSWPSHIDHIMVSDELFDNLENVRTVKFEQCFSNYKRDVSDHRPVILSLSGD